MATPLNTNTPGVYISETDAPALAVLAGATSVPVFAADPAQMPGDPAIAHRFSSWMDFAARAGEVDYGKVLHASLRAYFDNGGGYCYVVANNQLAALAPGLDATLLVAAGQTADADFGAAVDRLCRPGEGLFAIIDASNDVPLSAATPFTMFAGNMNVAAYYPWLSAAWAPSGTAIPPSAAMAGVYCTVDRERGVWKAPANVLIRGNLKALFKVTDALQGAHNDSARSAINMLRDMAGAGLTVWGARTLSRDAAWRYIPVRRLFDSVERDVLRAMGFALFEPNTQPTWERVRASVDNYLRAIWRQGALMGNTEQQAYFVQIGKGVTMTAQDIEQGRMIVTVGIAAVRPAEFIELRFTQNMADAPAAEEAAA